MNTLKTIFLVLFVFSIASCGNNDSATTFPAQTYTNTNYYPYNGQAPAQSGWYYANNSFCGVNPAACTGSALYYYGVYPISSSYTYTGWTGPYYYQYWPNYNWTGWGYVGAQNYFYQWYNTPYMYNWGPGYSSYFRFTSLYGY